MGIAIKVTDLDFSNNNLGQVTFLAGRVESISIDDFLFLDVFAL